MIKESRNLTSTAKLFAQFGDDTARISSMIGKRHAARFKSMFDRNLAAAQAGKPYDQTFMDLMYPKVERMFVRNQIPARDFRRFYNKSKLFNTAKNTILKRNNLQREYGGFLPPKKFSRAEQLEGLQYMRGLRSHTDLSKNISFRRELLDDARMHSQWHMNNIHSPQPHSITIGPDTTSFAKSQGFISREDLLRQAKKENVKLNKNDLHEPFYIDKETALASSQAVPKSPWLRVVAPAIDNELEYIGNSVATAKAWLQKAPRSMQRAAAIVNGHNILQPGTRANRFFTKLLNRKGIEAQTQDLKDVIQGKNAFYHSYGNFVASSPKISFKFRNKPIQDPAATEAHEWGHFFAHNLPEAEHRAIATTLFAKLKRAADRYNLNIPFDDPALMQEAFADGYAALKLGKVEPFNIRLNHAFYKAKVEHMNPIAYRSMIQNLKKINNAPDLDDVTKQMLNQLQINYGSNIFSKWV